jgi:primosomal protein N'
MQDELQISRSNINRFLCENCGANMVYDARTGGLLCAYCRHTQAVQVKGAWCHCQNREWSERVVFRFTGG